MTRIIAGNAKGLTLVVPAKGTRPTSDRVRESLFAVLEHELSLHESRVLDVFAGTGALGLEAVSRGARHADFVDLASSAIQALSRNVNAMARRIPEAQMRVHRKKASAFLEALLLSGARSLWELVLIDPPYDLPPAQVQRVLELLHPLIDSQTVVIVEESSHNPFGFPDQLYQRELHKHYGDTDISLLTKLG